METLAIGQRCHTTKVGVEDWRWYHNGNWESMLSPKNPILWRVGARPLLVKELVDEDTKQWNRDKNAHWFEPLTCRDILHIPLNNMHEKDTLTWNENRGRSFFVKTAYKVAKTSTPIIRWPLPSEAGRKSVEIYLGS